MDIKEYVSYISPNMPEFDNEFENAELRRSHIQRVLEQVARLNADEIRAISVSVLQKEVDKSFTALAGETGDLIVLTNGYLAVLERQLDNIERLHDAGEEQKPN